MSRPFQQIELAPEGDVFCVRLRQRRLDEAAVHQLGAELSELIDEHGCRKLALNLGPGPLHCLYSVFLAKLVGVQKHLQERQGTMMLCEAHPETRNVFKVCQLDDYFEFVADQAAAVALLSR